MKERQRSYLLTNADGKSRLRGLRDDFDFMLAVDPEGKIRTLRYGLNGMSSKLTSQEVKENGRLVGHIDIELTKAARREGWRELEDYYDEELAAADNETRSARMGDCDQVYAWYRHANTRKSGKIDDLDPAYLPEKLQDTSDFVPPETPTTLRLKPPSSPAKSKAKGRPKAAAAT